MEISDIGNAILTVLGVIASIFLAILRGLWTVIKFIAIAIVFIVKVIITIILGIIQFVISMPWLAFIIVAIVVFVLDVFFGILPESA